MTTIAWDGKTMAADGCVSGDVIIQGGVRKVYLINGGMAGFAGLLEDGMIFIDWLRKGADGGNRPEMDKDFLGLYVNASGRVTEFGPKLFGYRAGKPAAIGSGAAAAMGAMLAGKDALTAVKIAAKIDDGTRPPFRAYMLDK